MKNTIISTKKDYMYDFYKKFFNHELTDSSILDTEKIVSDYEKRVSKFDDVIFLDDMMLVLSNDFLSNDEAVRIVIIYNPTSQSTDIQYINKLIYDNFVKAFNECKRVTKSTFSHVLFDLRLKDNRIAFRLDDTDNYIIYSFKHDETTLKELDSLKKKSFTFFSTF